MIKNIYILWKLAFRSVFANWAKNKTIISIVSVSLIMIQILLSLSEGFGVQIKNFALDSLVGNYKIMTDAYKIEPAVKNNFKIPNVDEFLHKINSQAYVKGATKRVEIPAVIKSERSIRNIIIVGIDTKNEKDLSFIGKSYRGDFKKAFENNGILIGEELLQKLQTKVSYKVVVAGQDANEKLIETAFFITDTFTTSLPQMEEVYVFTDINNLNTIYNLNNSISEISIILQDQNKESEVYEKLKVITPKNLNLYTWGDLLGFLKGWLDMMYINMVIVFFIVFIAATLPLSNTLLISVLERMYEFGVLQAIGLKKSYLMLFILFESFFILSIGLGIGFVVGITLTYFLQDIGINISAFSKGAAGLGLGDYIYPKLDMYYSLLITGVLFMFGMIVSIYPAIRAASYNVVEALSKRT